MIENSLAVDVMTCGYAAGVLPFEVAGPAAVPRVVEGRPLACPQRCPEGPWRLAGPGWRLRHRAATPKAPLTWEGRPRRLRGTAAGAHRNDTRASSGLGCGGGGAGVLLSECITACNIMVVWCFAAAVTAKTLEGLIASTRWLGR